MASDKKYKAIIFDMGGVLIPPPTGLVNPEHADKARKIHETVYHPEFDAHFRDAEIGEISLEEMEVHLKEFYTKIHNDILEGSVFKSKVYDRPTSGLLPIWLPVLQKLRENGIILAVLTNNFYLDKSKSGKTTSLDEKDFDVIFESCKIGMRKPDKDIYEHVLKELKVQPEEAIFIDDTPRNVEGAKAVGIPSIWISGLLALILLIEASPIEKRGATKVPNLPSRRGFTGFVIIPKTVHVDKRAATRGPGLASRRGWTGTLPHVNKREVDPWKDYTNPPTADKGPVGS